MGKQLWVVTGGVASGKSTVMKWFAQHRVDTFLTDVASKEVRFGMREQIREMFGTLDPIKIREIVFSDKVARMKIEEMVVPGIMERFNQALDATDFLVAEVPVLDFTHPLLTGTIAVLAPMDVRIKRLMERDQISGELACKMVCSQSTDEERIQKADIVFSNLWDVDSLRKQTDIFYRTVCLLSNRKSVY